MSREMKSEPVSFDGVKDKLSIQERLSFSCGVLIGQKIRDQLADLPINEDVIIYALRYLGACALAMDTPPYPTEEKRKEREAVLVEQISIMGREMHEALVRTFERECPEAAKDAKDDADKEVKEAAA